MPKSKDVGIDYEDAKWIDECVDNHKMFRSEGTRLRVKIMMIASMAHIYTKVCKNKK